MSNPSVDTVIKKYGLLPVAAWSLIICLLSTISIYNHHENTIKEAESEARDYFRLNMFYREWNAKMGGVYVPIEKAEANPHLNVPNRDIVTKDNRQLTLINPAYMTRIVFGSINASSADPIISKLTSLKPLNPNNAPDEWEKKSLEAFERKESMEHSEVISISGKPYLRLISAFMTEEACLKCHAQQGYRVGAVRGAITISVPLTKRYALQKKTDRNILSSYALLWLVGTIGIAISARRRSNYENTILANEQKFRTVCDWTLDWEYWKSPDGKIKYISPSCLEITGYSQQEFMNDSALINNIIHPDHRALFTDHYAQGGDPTSQKTEILTFKIITKEGQERWIEHVCRPVYENSVYLGRRASNRDITERKRISHIIAESEERFRSLIEQAPEAIIVIDVKDGRIIDANPAAEHLFGCSRDELLQGGLQRFYAQEQPDGRQVEESMAEYTQRVLSGEKVAIERSIRTPDGKRLICEVHLALLPSEDRHLIRGCFLDITSHKRNEAIMSARLRLLEYATCHSTDELLQKTLDEAENLTGSCIGFYHFVDPDEQALTLHAWSTRTAQEFCKAKCAGSHYAVSVAGVWVDCIHERRPVIHNDYNALFHRKGMPEGHAKVTRELVVPVFRNGKIVAVLGVGNKEIDYNHDDVETVCLLADLAWDTVERKLAEERYRQLFDKMLDGYALHEIICDDQGQPVNYRFLTVNPAFETLTGLNGREIIGKTVLDIMPETENCWIKEFGRVALTGETLQFENFSTAINKHFKVSAFRPEPMQFACVFTDITERKKAEDDLRHSYDLLNYIIKYNTSALAVHDKDLKYLFVSERYLIDYKVKDRDIIGKHHYEVFPDLPQKWRDVHQKALAGIISHAENDRYDREDGSVEWTTWECRPWYEANGEVGGIVIYTEIVTDRMKAEEQKLLLQEQLHQSQKMEAIGQLAGGIAHDFNNILTVIEGYSEMLKMSKNLDSNQREHVEQIFASAEKAAQLTRGLLAFSRKQPLVMKHENLNDIVQHVHKFLARIIGEDITFQSICCGTDLPIVGDKNQLEQVLINLTTNARDAMPHGGSFTIKSEQVVLDSSFTDFHKHSIPPGKYALLTVSDTGTGIQKDQLNHIFEPFFTTKAVGKGTGLGMAIIYGIIKQHNGFINVCSERGQGTTFRIYLPILEAADQPINCNTVEYILPKGGHETILVAEDEPNVRELLSTILTSSGYQAILAEDGDDAIAKFKQDSDRISLLLVDMIMPKKSGWEVYEEIQRIKPGIKVVFSSGYTADFIENRGASGAGIELLMKPVQPTDLLRKIREMLDA